MFRSIALSSALLLLYTTSAADGTCDEDSLSCDNGQCVRREDWCDDSKACNDGSDEAYCGERTWYGKSPNKCNEKIHFRCDDGLCWPLAARCDGTVDCRDNSDEDSCDSEKKPDEETDEIKVNVEEANNKADEDKPSETSGEEGGESTDISEENGWDEFTTATETPTFFIDDYEDYDEPTEIPFQTTTVEDLPPSPPIREPSSTERPSFEVSPEGNPWSPATEMDFYAKRMGQNEVKQHSTKTKVQPTSAYRPPPTRSFVQYPTRPYINQYTTSRSPAVPYTGPTRPYTPRSYRYIGSGQTPSPYRGRYQAQQLPYPPGGYRGSYHSGDSNYISSQPRTNHRQQYHSFNGNNGRADWRNGVTQPPRIYGRQLRAPSRFYFKKNYNEIYGKTNKPSVRRGADWILSIRNATGGWGKETPRALVALSLVNNSFLAGNYDNDLMHKYFQVHLAVKLLRDEPVSLNRLAMFVNALIATCQDPRDFQGWDLTELIRNTMLKLHRTSRPPVINPLVYLSLCLADRNLTHYEVHHLMTYLAANRNDEATRDMTCLALEAFACHMRKERHNTDQYYTLQKMVWNATLKILQRKKDDGSFGSVYSTALAVQALLSVNETQEWNPEPTFRFLSRHQQRNGSFGDFLATYQVLPALSGRSLLHLRNTECNPPRVDRELTPQEILQHPGPKSYIRYSLHLGSPLSTGYTVQVLVPTGISFFDVMRVAAYENDHFKFSYEEVNGKIQIYSISDIPNDPEEGLAWRLYVRSPLDIGNIPDVRQIYTGDIRELFPTPDQHVIFWYHPLSF
ncbi:unnamed protein product [Larinioides sclopetarius]|uniref:Uncharacterized protein n=1 Tax=Larinioides sclopetarius TaxID=280406 RepID=A0AAV2AKI8_9ARAC